MPTFEPPFRENQPIVSLETPREVRGLWRHYAPHPNGVTVYKLNGVWIDKQVPLNSDLAAADHVFLGGHIYTVSEAVAAELEAAGYTVE